MRVPTDSGSRSREHVIMVVRIRLMRMGHRNLPFYRIVVADARFPRDGRFIENVRHIDEKSKVLF